MIERVPKGPTRLLVAALISCALVACDSELSSNRPLDAATAPDGRTDSTSADAAPLDARGPLDGSADHRSDGDGAVADGAAADSAVADSRADATPSDAPPSDTAPSDTAPLDAGVDGASAISHYPISTAQALARPASQITALSGVATSQYVNGNPGADRTFDLRSWSSTAFPSTTLYPLSIGKANPAHRTVVVGGKVVGGQSSALTWHEMKASYDGAGILIFGSASGDWLIVDGARYDNMMDDLRPRGIARFVLRNIWSRNTRDDVIENDEVRGGLIHDCLFESAYMFLSEQNGTWDGSYGLEISHVLVRLEPMAYDTSVTGQAPAPGSLIDGKAHGQLFKHFGGGDTPLDVHDSVFYVSRLSVNGVNAMNFPGNATWKNNVLIWAGGGAYPGTLPASGVEERNLTQYSQSELDGFWNVAVAKWKARHGVTTFDNVDMVRFVAPDPF